MTYYETTGYFDRPQHVITDARSGAVAIHAHAFRPDHVHQITQAALAELVDPTPASLVQRALTALEHTTPAEDTPCACCGKPDDIGVLDNFGRCDECLQRVGRGLDWIEGAPC